MFETYTQIGDANTQTTLNSSLLEEDFIHFCNASTYNVQDEVAWGKEYQNLRSTKSRSLASPEPSHLDIPYNLCAERVKREILRRYNPLSKCLRKDTERPYTQPIFSNILKVNKKSEQKSCECKKSVAKTRKKSSISGCNKNVKTCRGDTRSKTTPSLLDRSTMSQKQYMDLLSTPNIIAVPQDKPKKKRKCVFRETEKCSPRLLEMSIPMKRLVLENWRQYSNTLSSEKIENFDRLLHTNQNLEPKLARCYFKHLQNEKQKKIRHNKRLKRKKIEEKNKGEKEWLNKIINDLAASIVNYIKQEPLFSLNYKEMLLSDSILDNLSHQDVFEKPKRNTKNVEKKTVLDITDKIAFWANTLLVSVEENLDKIEMQSLYVADNFKYD